MTKAFILVVFFLSNSGGMNVHHIKVELKDYNHCMEIAAKIVNESDGQANVLCIEQ